MSWRRARVHRLAAGRQVGCAVRTRTPEPPPRPAIHASTWTQAIGARSAPYGLSSALAPCAAWPLSLRKAPARWPAGDLRELAANLFDRLVGQADVVLGDGPAPGFGADEVVQLGLLHALAEGVGVGESVQHRGHPPGEALGLPDAPQADFRVLLQQVAAALAVVDLEQDAVQRADVAGGQVEHGGAAALLRQAVRLHR